MEMKYTEIRNDTSAFTKRQQRRKEPPITPAPIGIAPATILPNIREGRVGSVHKGGTS